MIAIFASMLNERRIVITSDRLSRLSACVQAANALIYPMHWQHIFIPLLPSSLLDYLSAPMPFLVGVPQATLATVRRSELLEVVLLNADTNQLTTPYDDVNSLPSEVVHSLRKALKSNGNGGGGGSGSGSGSSSAVVNGSGSALGDGLSRAFMRALVSLIGGYRSALRIVPGEQITFDRELFLSSSGGGGGLSKSSTSRQLFLERLLQLQIFQQFIETRLDLFNAGQRLDDQFEMELNTMETGSGVNSRFRAQYREWAAVMKKEGGAFLRAVNPKVKSAISKSRQAVRTLRSKIGTNQNGGGGNNSGGSASSNGGGGSSPASSRQNSSTPSSPKLPPKIKKSISGTAISQTSRTVTYVRTPNSTVSTAGMGGKGGNHHRSSVVRTTPNGTPTSTSTPIISTASTNVSSSRSSTLSVPSYASSSSIAPSASSESFDVDEMDASGGGGFGAPSNQYSSSVPRVDMNITAELESIFRNKATLATAGVTTNGGTSSTQRPLITTNNNSNSFSSAAAPIPPPRTNNNANNNNASSSSSSSTPTSDKFGHLNRHSLKPATLALAKQAAEQAAGGAGNHRASAPEKCLIEFDSPPKDGLSPNGPDQRNKAASSSALGALVHFDPLLEGSYGQQASSPPGVTQQQQQQQHPTSTAAFFNASLQQQPLNSGNLFFTPNNNNNNVHAFANNFNSSTSNGFGYGNGQVLQQQQQQPPPALYPVLRSNGHNLLQRAPPMAQTQPAPPLPPPSSTLATNVNVMALRGRFEMHPAPFHNNNNNNNNTANNSTANSSGKQQQPPLVTTGGQTGASGASGNPFQAHCWQEFD